MLQSLAEPHLLSGFDSHDGLEVTAHSPTDAITVPDAHLLFSGDFKRAGTDLIISDKTHQFVVHDYFRGELRPALLSPEGASLSASVVEALTGHGEYAQAGPPTQNAGTVIGRVDKVTGEATAVRNGVAVTLHVGDNVQKGDVIQTGAGSEVAVSFTDGTAFDLKANARMQLNDFVYQANATNNSAFIDLVQGTISFVAGEVAHTGDMKVKTPVATMGIRGTAVLVTIETNNGPTTFSIVPNPNSNVVGSFVLLDNNTGQVFATVNQVGVAVRVTPTGPLQVIAQELNLSPQQVQQNLVAVQEAYQAWVNTQQNPVTPNQPNNNQPDNNQNNPNNPNHTQNSGSGGQPISGTVTPLDNGNNPNNNNPNNNNPNDNNNPNHNGPDNNLPSGPPDNSNNNTVTTPIDLPTNLPAFLIGGPNVTVLSVPNGGDASHPVTDAAGNYIVFDPTGEIFLADRHHPETAPISLSDLVNSQNASETDYDSFSNPAISADGRYVVFQGNFGGGHDVFVARNDGNGNFCVTELPGGFDAKIDGGGFHIVMEEQNGGHQDVALLTRDDNGNWSQQTTICGDAAICNPNISASGHIITFSTAASTITIGGQTFHVGGDGTVETYVYDTHAQNPWEALNVVSVSTEGHVANGDSVGTASLSQDGQFIVFESTASNIDGGGCGTNVYLRDIVCGTTTLISRGTDGQPGNGDSFDAAISPDGKYVVFASDANDLVNNDTNDATDVFLYNIHDHTLLAISDVTNPLGAGQDGLGLSISGGGVFVTYGQPGANGGPSQIVVTDLSNLTNPADVAGTTGIVIEEQNSPNPISTTGKIDFTDTSDTHTVAVLNDPVNGDWGTLTAVVSTDTTGSNTAGEITWTYTVNSGVAAQLNSGEYHTDTFTINLTDGDPANVTPITVTEVIVGTNETPVIGHSLPTDVNPTITADGAPVVSGQLSAFDPDQGDTLTWTIEGGTRMVAPDFQFVIDEFTVTRGNFDDQFNGTTPPNGPPFGTAPQPYSVTGGFEPGTNQVLIEGSDAVFQGIRGDNYVFGDFATLNSNTQPLPNILGLKSHQTFDVSGVFDLTQPPDAGDAYGIRLIDRINSVNPTAPAGSAPAQPGTESVELAIVHGNSSDTVDVQLRQIDFATQSSVVLASIELAPGDLNSNYQILLSLENDALDNGNVHASYELGTVDGSGIFHGDSELSGTFDVTGRIFDNEDWTHAQFFGSGFGQQSNAPSADSILTGQYGTLDLTQTGTWTYAINDGLAATRALAAGQHATDTFTVDVTDNHGNLAQQVINVDVVGINDAPVAHDDTLVSNVDHTFVENSFNTIHTSELLANDTDPDSNTTLTVTSVSAHSAHGGSVTLNNDGTITYEGDEDFFGADSFTYTTSDGSLTSTATVSFFVTPFSTAPVSWTGNQDSNWDHSGNWSSGQVPGGNSEVILGDFSHQSVVVTTAESGGVVEAHSLDLEYGAQLQATEVFLDSILAVGAGSCSAATTGIVASNADLTISAVHDIEMAAGTYNADADSTVQLLSDQSIAIGNVAGVIELDAQADACAAATAEIQAAGGDLTIGAVGGFTLSAVSYSGADAHAEISANNYLTIGDVAGDFTIVGGGGNSPAQSVISATNHDISIGNIGSDFSNQGTIQADHGTLTIGAVFGDTFVNSGTMQAGAINISVGAPGNADVFQNDGTLQGWGFANSTIGVGVYNTGTFTVGGGEQHGLPQDIGGFGVTIFGQVQNVAHAAFFALDGGFVDLTGGLGNSGLVEAAGVAIYGNTYTLAEIDISGCVTNTGAIQAGDQGNEISPAIGGGLIVFQNADVDNTGGIIVAYEGGAINIDCTTVTGGNIEAHGIDSAVFLFDATIVGGLDQRLYTVDGGTIRTVANGDTFTHSTLDGSASTLTNDAYIQIVDNTGLALRGEIDNENFISVGVATPGAASSGARLIIDGHVTLDGQGDVVMQGLGNFIDGLPSNGCDTLDNVDNYIHGTGQIGDQYLTLSNEGLIAATGTEDGVNTIVIDTGTNVVENDGGTIEAITGGQMTIVSDISNDSCGLIQSCGDGSVLTIDGVVCNSALVKATFGGEVELNGTVHNNGYIVAADGGAVVVNSNWFDNCGTLEANGGTLELVQGIGGNQTVTFGSNGGLIKTDNVLDFVGAGDIIAGFVAGVAGGAITAVDFDNLGFGPASEMNSYTVWDSATNILELHFLGFGFAYFINFDGTHNQGDFALRSDGFGGTEIISSPATVTFAAGGLDTFGNATEGQQLTALFDATVSGGNVGPITYTWIDDGQIVLSGIGDNVYTPTHAGDDLVVVASFIDPTDGATDFVTGSAGIVNLAPVQGGLTDDWTSSAGGDWNDANWSGNNPPQGDDNVVIAQPVGNTVTFDGHGSAHDSAIIDGLTIGGGVTFDVINQGFVTLFGGDLDNSGTIDVINGAFGFGNLDDVNTGTMIAEQNGSIDGHNSVFTNDGQVIAEGVGFSVGTVDFGIVSGNGVLVVDGGLLSIDPIGAYAGNNVDTNDIQFSTAPTGLLTFGAADQVSGHISGFAANVNGETTNAPRIVFDNANLSVPVDGYHDNGDHSGVLDLHPTSGSDISLTFYGDYTASNFLLNYETGSQTNTVIFDQGPVISAAGQQTTGDESSTTLSGLQVFDGFASSDNFTITASAGHGTLSLAIPDDDPGLVPGSSISATTTLADINTVLSHGIVYTPNDPEPTTDAVTVRVTDAGGGSTNGAIDELHLIFNVSGENGATLAGTNGKDVLYGTGNDDTLTGGQSSDTFVFKGFTNGSELVTGHDTITDFNVAQDMLQLDANVFGSNLAALLNSASNDGHGNATITGADANSSITFDHMTVAQLQQAHINFMNA